MNVMELEKGFVINNPLEIREMALRKGYQLTEESEETDTYFTDSEEEFVKTRTCLRIRRKDEEYMELTYKSRSSKSTELYGKREVNIPININDFDDIAFILAELGYKKYVEFTKSRKVYSKTDGNVEYNIMLDNLKGIGDYAEFEVITDENVSDEERAKALARFVSDFKMTNAPEKSKPYRDIAKAYYDRNIEITFP